MVRIVGIWYIVDGGGRIGRVKFPLKSRKEIQSYFRSFQIPFSFYFILFFWSSNNFNFGDAFFSVTISRSYTLIVIDFLTKVPPLSYFKSLSFIFVCFGSEFDTWRCSKKHRKRSLLISPCWFWEHKTQSVVRNVRILSAVPMITQV